MSDRKHEATDKLSDRVIGLTGRKDTGSARAQDQRSWRWRDLGLNFIGVMSPDSHNKLTRLVPCHLHLTEGETEAQRGQAAGLESHSSGGAPSSSKSMLDTLGCCLPLSSTEPSCLVTRGQALGQPLGV